MEKTSFKPHLMEAGILFPELISTLSISHSVLLVYILTTLLYHNCTSVYHVMILVSSVMELDSLTVLTARLDLR